MEEVIQFKYLGRPMDQPDDDCPELQRNVERVQKVWGGIGKDSAKVRGGHQSVGDVL